LIARFDVVHGDFASFIEQGGEGLVSGSADSRLVFSGDAYDNEMGVRSPDR
jgi:hypothetical protein